MKRTLLTLSLLFVLGLGGVFASERADSLSSVLKTLDDVLADREDYVTIRRERIDYLKSLAESCETLEQKLSLSIRLFEECYPYNFDLALSYANNSIEIANELNNSRLLAGCYLDLARLYTVAGMYTEALSAFQKVNIESLESDRVGDYYAAHIHFARDFKEYSKDAQMRRSSGESLAQYRKQLYNMPRRLVAKLPTYTRDSLSARLLDYYDHEQYDDALACSEKLMELTREGEHYFAIASYYMSLIRGQLGDVEGQSYWLARSAISDIRLAVKDNASLCVLASILAGRGEVERAFTYINASIDDAMFYNAKLRQWQVASRMNAIEQVYHDMVRSQQHSAAVTSVVVSLLACVLLVACVYVVRLLRRTRKTQQALRAKKEEVEAMNAALSQTNRQLQSLNLTIAEANMVKEEYIGLFLSMCSDYIDKIASMQRRVRKGIKSGSIAALDRDFPSNDIIDAEKEHFYEVFDSAFLNLYPNFVEEFNSLLEEDGQIELKKGERLNTELRIFALIRLGITDSSKIALLLHYSVNTIYNYRAKVKNRAKGDRDNFEQIIKTIGSFKN